LVAVLVAVGFSRRFDLRAETQSSYHKLVGAPFDSIQEHKNLSWLFASPKSPIRDQ
jgi:hypothetical protein